MSDWIAHLDEHEEEAIMKNRYVRGEVGTALIHVGDERPFGGRRVRLFRIQWNVSDRQWMTEHGVLVTDEVIVDYQQEWAPKAERMAPGTVFRNSDGSWAWDCYRKHEDDGSDSFGEEPSHDKAFDALEAHNAQWHRSEIDSLLMSAMRREAEASVRMDRGETFSLGHQGVKDE